VKIILTKNPIKLSHVMRGNAYNDGVNKPQHVKSTKLTTSSSIGYLIISP